MDVWSSSSRAKRLLALPDLASIRSIVETIAADIAASRRLGVEIALVVGGGNIFRGVEVSNRGVSRPTGDTMGMLATVMNSLVMEAAHRAPRRAGGNPVLHPDAHGL